MSSGRARGNFWRGRGQRFRGRKSARGTSQTGRAQRGSDQGSSGPQVQHQRARQIQTSLTPCPFKKWNLYFPDIVYNPDSALATKVKAIMKFVESHAAQLSKDEIESKAAVMFDYMDLISDTELAESFPSFAGDLRDQPTEVLHSISLAVSQVLLTVETAESPHGAPLFDLPYIQARITNFEPAIPLKNLKSCYWGKFVAIHGTVIRVSNVKPLVKKMAFSCNLCSQTQVVHLTDGKYSIPTQCSSVDCRGKSFTPERSSPMTETIDWQTIKVQEIMDDDQRESGRIPRTVECELTADLVDSCVPGDMVTVTGIVKATGTEENRNKSNKDKCMFLLYLHVNAVNNNKGGTGATEQTSGLAMEFSIKELYAIQEIQAQKNLFRLIVGSLCPSIYGHEMVKAGLVLGLFGGTQRYLNDKNRIPVRGNPHILVVGDPGLGKSQMLQAVSNVAPRGVYVCGNATSTSGLTVTLSKEGSSGDYSLEAGALVLGDQGCCCIDEFDKMGSQHQALLEAMEQQSISIAKAGVVCSLPARTSILAAANPVGGHYNKAKTVSENLKMGSALLSRFDLVFILLDKPDEEMDCMLSEHVMALHAGKKSAFGVVTARRRSREDSSSDEDEMRRQWEADKPLSERLKIARNEEFDAIPSQLLRKYVGYARTYVHPKLTPAAAEVLQNFYLDLRQQHHSADSTPITTRQLESLIRLTQVRARLEMREKASQQDGKDVVEIMNYRLLDTFRHDLGNLDFQRSQHGSGKSSRAQSKRFVAELSRISEREYNSLFIVEQMRKIAKDIRLQIRIFDDFVFSLNNQGFLLKKGPRVYQLQTSNCL
ncbi:DNA helicase MCM8-like [Pocillopora damicornis]|uniref:DNA helicase MCM8-like n=1 Tax=Pocillopora damicornis TaxID=46731 RepID=UPI000F551482|nr:DNA helicase MCM8-like [Pocillopora damicornis]